MNGILPLLLLRTWTSQTSGTSLLTPVNTGTVNTTTPQLTFAGQTVTGDQRVAYELQIDTSSSFDSQTATTQLITALVWGAGGGGSGSGSYGGGGAGGNFSLGTVTATSGTGYTVTVGTGGTAATNASGGNGGQSSFLNSSTVMANGGNGASTTSGGTNGSAGVGTTTHTGGTGGSGVSGNFTGGGGGGGAGSVGNGGNGGAAGNGVQGAAGAAGSPDGGAGALGGSSGGGAAGTAPGGGGSGAGNSSGNAGGVGARGQVIIRAPLGTVASATGGTHTSDATYDYWTFTTSGTWTPTISQSFPLYDKFSGVDAGFADVTAGSGSSPYPSNNTIGFTPQTALVDGTTYYWRVRETAVPQSNVTYNTAWATTRSFTVSTVPRYTRTHTTDTNKRKTNTKTHTTDSYLGPRRPTRTHTTDVNKYTNFTKFRSHTTDVNRKKAGITRIHTTDVAKRTPLLGATRTHTTDILKFKRATRVHTTDTLKLKRTTKTHTTDAYKTPHTTVVDNSYTPLASSDDAYEVVGGTTSLADTEIDMIGTNHVGIRFRNVAVAQGTTISKAFIIFPQYIGASSNFNSTFDGVTLKGEAVDNSSAFTATATNIGSRARTTATGSTYDAFDNHYTDGVTGVDVTTVVQEILNRGGWASGNAMSMLWIGDGVTTSDKFQAYSWDYFSGSEAAQLHIQTSSTTARSMARRHTTDVYTHVAVATTYTRTHTTDTYKVNRGVKTHTTDTNKRKATVKTHTTDIFLRQSANYTRQAVSVLPTDATDLSGAFSAPEYGTVAADDSTYVNLIGANFNVYEFKWENTNHVQAITVTWNGKSTIATSTKTAYLQIYNYNSSTWETLTSNSTTGANTDFTMTAKQGTNVGNYYSGNFVAARVYQ